MAGNKSKETPAKRMPRISARDPKFATILVGLENARFVVHEELLTSNSDFFRAALTRNFKEGKDKTVTLEKDDPETFELFVFWLYHGRFPGLEGNDPEALIQMWTGIDLAWGPESYYMAFELGRLLRLYVFADRYQVPKLKRVAMDGFFDSGLEYFVESEGLDFGIVKYAFEHLPPGSGMCRFLIDASCMWDCGSDTSEWVVEKDGEYPYKYMLGRIHRYAFLMEASLDATTDAGNAHKLKRLNYDDDKDLVQK